MTMKKTATRAIAIALFTCLVALCAGCGPTGIGAVSTASSSNASEASASPASPASSASAADASASGEHAVDVSLSGGSGRASIESPAKVTVSEDGSMTLTIVWSSSNYDKMVVDGVEYAPVNESGNSTFEIPIATLGEDLPVQAETTAMSQPHMIDYVISFGAAAVPVEADVPAEADAGSTAQVADFHNADLGNGWQVARSLPLQYAQCFTVDYYEGGYKLLCLSDGARYLLVPKGADVPAGIDGDIVAIQQPISDVYLVASDTMCLFDALDALDRITVSGISRDNWYIPSAIAAMESGAMVYGGKYNAPDYELLLGKGVRLAIESTMINHTPSVREKLIELGIPVFTEMSSYESEPLGRTEWVKCYGAMLNLEDEAQSLFDEQIAQVSAVDSQPTGKTVAFFYINSNGNAVTRRPGDYVTKMIEQAGGSVAFQELADIEGTMSSITLEMERFYSMAKDADVIIYNASIDGSVSSVADLLQKNPLLSDFKAVQSGEVWVTDQNMYQQMMHTGDIIADFNVAITGSGADTTYVHKLE